MSGEAMGRFLLIFVALLIPTMFFAYPPIIEQSGGECSALEQRVEDVASRDGAGRLTVSALYGSSSSGPSGGAFAGDRYPLLPASVGCAVAYWESVAAGSPAAAAGPAPADAATMPSPGAAESPGNGVVAIIARDITPNGDPISPDTTFTLPMNAVAIRAEYPPRTAGTLRFQLLQGKAVLSTCAAQKALPNIAWCKFAVGLRKGFYAISFGSANTVLGQFPFTVIGR
jgi:hypothetical protein